MVGIPINLTPVRFMLGDDRFAHLLESLQVGPGIPVTEFTIGEHRNPGFEELGSISTPLPVAFISPLNRALPTQFSFCRNQTD